MTAVDAAHRSSNRRPIILLAAQAFALGLTVAWTTIPASAIFLDAYGSGALPYTYVGAAAAGAVSSAVLTRAFRRRSLMWVTMRVLAALAAVLAAAFVGLSTSGPWVSVALLVLVPILVPVGFMFVVGQAGMLLDVRVLKAFYARVIAGFALGFVIGGLAGPPLLALIGTTERLLLFAAAVAGGFLVLAWVTERSFPAELSAIGDTADADAGSARPTIVSLLRNRYVLYIVAFQMLSAVESQWLDYLVFDRAAARYASSEALADFISRFTAIAYGADIVFLLVIAGVLLRRFGLRYGLVANSAVVLALVALTILSGTLQGSGATVVFVLIVASRVSDLTLSDGATRTSLGAAYQAVGSAERLAAQATVEGLAVPVAIGVSGVVLIVVRGTVGTGGLALPVLTSLVVIAWIAVAVALQRGYRANLLANLRHRVLDPSTLAIDDPSTLAALDRLLDSDDERNVRLGLQTLEAADHPALQARLMRLSGDRRVGVRSYALDRLAAVDAAASAAAARAGLGETDAAMLAMSIRTLALTGEPADAVGLAPMWDAADDEVKVALATLIARLGDDAAKRSVSAATLELSRAPDRRGPVLAARVLASGEPGSGIDRAPLRELLAHPDHEVVEAALAAVRWPDDIDLLGPVARRLDEPRTAAAAVQALASGGSVVLAFIDEGLRGEHGCSRSAQKLLARAGRHIGGAGAASVLLGHLGHPDRDVGLAVALALADVSPAPAPGDASANADALDAAIRVDLLDATCALRALTVLGDGEAFASLRRAVGDELEVVQQHLLACLSVRYGREGMNRVAFQLAGPDARSHALALEWLEATLAGTDRAYVALAEPDWSPAERLRALGRRFPLPDLTVTEVLRDLVDDPDGRWRRPWLTACALVAAADAGVPGIVDSPIGRPPVPGGPAPDRSIVEEALAQIRARHPAAPMPASG
jgi:hypothetical protein